MEKKRLLEFSLKTSFFEPYFLGRPFEFEGTVIASRKRQRSFDADFLKASLQITKTLIPKLSYSLKYQLEAIEQFDFSHSKDEGFVRIGSMKPSLSYDFRKNKISPREGGIFGISAEFASPIFFSMKGLGKEVNYLKLISRNRYYINWGKWVYAISLSLGFQKNLASDVLVDANGLSKKEADGSYQLKGFIPSIKVFNLNGVDSVRGYSPNEINKLDSGENIGDIVVRNSAYFSNLKLEPRYYFNDQFAFSLFIDGGRLFINSFKPLKMRFGAGIGVKVLTPVGSLDFDYGIKLKREEISGGHKEEFGRFHLSIGFF
jgi:outer membrane protein insertion porin family